MATLASTLALTGNLNVIGGVFDLDANPVDIGGSLTVVGTLITDGADVRVAGDVTVTGVLDAGAGRLVLGGTTTQLLDLGGSPLHHVTVDNPAGGALAADLEVGGALDLIAGTLTIGSHRLTIERPMTGLANNLIADASSSLTVAGTTADIRVPDSITDLAELEITNPAGVSIGGSLTLHSILELAGGNLDGRTHTVTIAAGGSVVRTSGHVIGQLVKPIPAGGPLSVTFEIGDTLGYAPVEASWGSVGVTGTMTASTSAGDDAAGLSAVGLVPAASVNRTWTFTSNGLAAGPELVTVTYLASDLDPDARPTDLLAALSSGGSSVLPVVTLRTATSLTMSLAGAPGGTLALAMPAADVAISLNGPTDGLVDQPYPYLVTVTNAGPFDAGSIEVEIRLPAEVSMVSASPSQGSCGKGAPVLTCDLRAIPSGSSAEVRLVLSFASPGVYLLMARAMLSGTAVDPAMANDGEVLEVAISDGVVPAQLPDTASSTPDLLVSIMALTAMALISLLLVAAMRRVASRSHR